MKFYCIALHPQAKKPTYVHSTFKSAEIEAARLAKKLNCDVVIVEAIATVQIFKEEINGAFAVSFHKDGSKNIVSDFQEKDDLPF